MRRQKRKPDNIQLNFVESLPKRGRSLQFRRVSYPLDKLSEEPLTGTCSGGVSSIDIPGVDSQNLGDGYDGDGLSNDPESSTRANHSESHTERKEKAARAWSELRPTFVPVVISATGFPLNVMCTFCKSSSANIWCKDCGTSAYLCEECTQKLHRDINLFHSPLLWKDDIKMYIPFPLQVSLGKDCACSTVYKRQLTCVDKRGCYHSISVSFCSCETEAETLMRVHLFPATPKQSQLAFSFELLDWLEALMLECQVSTKDFVAAIDVLTDVQLMKTRKCNLYLVIIDSFEEYRFLKNELRHLKLLVPEREHDGTKCPACPKDGKVFFSIDGNFGLCRKKAAGNSVRPPLHEKTVFFDQESVDKYVQGYCAIQMSVTKECNQFLAGDALRSRSRYKALDETGVVGIVCRHEFPHSVFSLRHGERLSYIVYALERLLESCQQHSRVSVLYDVACTLQKHLHKQGRTDLLGFFHFAIPVFHTYGHKVDCQLKYSPRNLNGFGLTDGECVERLWSYLRRFSRMTKEMRPSHRVDVLSDALVFYSRQSTKRLANMLSSRINRAIKIQQESKKMLEDLMQNSSVKFSTADIEHWYQDEIQPRAVSRLDCSEEVSWEARYFSLLKVYYDIRDELRTCNPGHLPQVCHKLNRVDADLKVMEDERGIQRWSKHSDVYCDFKRIEEEKEKNRIIEKIATCARERWFLLNLKAKFADGQYLASRLSKSINQESAKLKQLLQQYNTLPGAVKLSWNDATDLSSYVHSPESDVGVPRKIRLNAIKHHHMILRADEEVQLLQSEMNAVVSFFHTDWQHVSSAVQQLKLTWVKVQQCQFTNLPLLPVEKFLSSLHSYPNQEVATNHDVSHELLQDEPDVGTLPHMRVYCGDEQSYSSDEESSDSENESTHDPDDHQVMQDHQSLAPPTTVSARLIPPHSSQAVNLPTPDHTTAKPRSNEAKQPHLQMAPIQDRHVHIRGMDINVSDTDKMIKRSISATLPVKKPKLRPQEGPDQRMDLSTTVLMRETDTSSLSGESDDDFFPSTEQIRQRCLRLEREEYLQNLRKEQSCYEFSEEEKRVLANIKEGTTPGHKVKRGYLHWKKEDLERAVESSRRAISLSRVTHAGPHFIRHAKKKV